MSSRAKRVWRRPHCAAMSAEVSADLTVISWACKRTQTYGCFTLLLESGGTWQGCRMSAQHCCRQPA